MKSLIKSIRAFLALLLFLLKPNGLPQQAFIGSLCRLLKAIPVSYIINIMLNKNTRLSIHLI